MVHTPLDPHLHTEECNVIIAALKKCQAETSLASQIFGVCNDLDQAMRKCTKNERLTRTRKILDESKVKNADRQKKIAEQVKQGKSWRDVLQEKAEKKEENSK